MSKKDKIKNGIGDLRFIAALAAVIGIIVIALSTWNGIKVSVDTYIENKNNNIVEYTKNFIETKNDENIDKEDIEYIETKNDANMYMVSYIADTVLYITITVFGTIGFWRLANFYNKENMKNPYDEKVINYLKTTQKFMNATWVIWLIGTIIQVILFMSVTVGYSSSIFLDIIIYLVANAFIQFIIFILEKGQLKKTSKEA